MNTMFRDKVAGCWLGKCLRGALHNAKVEQVWRLLEVPIIRQKSLLKMSIERTKWLMKV